MRGAEEEPEGLDDAPAAPAHRRAGGRLLVPLVVVCAAVVVAGAAAGGPARFTPFSFGGQDSTPLSPDPLRTVPPPRPPAQPLDVAGNPVVQTILMVVAWLITAVVVVVLIRLLLSAIRNRRRRAGVLGLRAAGSGSGPEVADAPAVLRGIAAALMAIDEDREPGDSVVRAWLGLQQAAEDAGFARLAAETPTEFTGRVLSRTGADRVALGTLLRLYLRARFGDDAITDVDTADAREALRALEASWERVTAGSRG